MSNLTELIQALLPHLATEAEADEAYLNQSVDLNDLERRMHEIDVRGRADTTGLVQGLFLP
ncbi:DUF3563 family protein [Ideonella sp. A 288]|uniref:DUF3563 family protein n=1 Tax=Ideonella sp. A 288 TaxID=1962181 RepID=UPI000B4B0828|nr:DUF3563 family protein [Ideonella sp. A 288]